MVFFIAEINSHISSFPSPKFGLYVSHAPYCIVQCAHYGDSEKQAHDASNRNCKQITLIEILIFPSLSKFSNFQWPES